MIVVVTSTASTSFNLMMMAFIYIYIYRQYPLLAPSVHCPQMVWGCVCACACGIGIVRNELICWYAKVVHISSSFRTHTHTHILIPFEDRELTGLKVDIAHWLTENRLTMEVIKKKNVNKLYDLILLFSVIPLYGKRCARKEDRGTTTRK